MGLIPIHVYIDEPWLPYGNLLNNISYSITMEELPGLIQKLEKMTDSEIASMEKRIMELREDYFTFDAAIKHIGEFMLRPMGSMLKCQALPSNSGADMDNTICGSMPGLVPQLLAQANSKKK